LRVNVEHEHARHVRHRDRLIAQLDAEHLVKIRGGVRADQKHVLACVSQRDGHRRGDRRFANPALAGEEHIFGGLIEQFDGWLRGHSDLSWGARLGI
jgi:hypothetical protein